MPLTRSTRHLPRPSLVRPFSTTPPHRQTIPYTPTCPPATCACASTPEGLAIDRKTLLLHTTPPYAEHVLICTGKQDWTSRIEDETSPSGDFARGLRSEIGRGGKAFDPYTPTLTTLSSLPSSPTPNTTTALLFPSFLKIPAVPNTPDAYAAFASTYLRRASTPHAHATLLPTPQPITTPTILICGHTTRDSRCGTLGPLLRDAFRAHLQRRNVDAEVALISHIGGHKYAGNVIIYVPPAWEEHALRGSGIWYGRVGPENVEGVVEETVIGGRVVGELLRGGITQGRGDIARMVEGQMKGEKGEEEGLRLRPRARGGA